MTEEEMFSRQVALTFETQRNKRRGHDALVYENHFVANCVRGTRRRMDRTLRIDHNYAFLTPTPRWREIMATEFEGRKIDHEVCDVIIPLAEQVLSPYTYNNRKGKGAQAAINQLIEHIYEVTEGYTRPARIIKIDFKGFFPSALWDYAEQCLLQVPGLADDDYLRWLIMIALHCNPAAHCERRTARHLWHEHIDPEKSLFSKPEGEGAAIGRLIWQTAMGLYVNDIILWLTRDCGLRLVCFVDDIVMVVPEERHQYALSLLPELRRRLAERNIRLNERKFYDQPFENGCEFLGTHLRPMRLHLNNSTYRRAVARIRKLNSQPYKDIDAMVSTFNSYSGLLKNRTDHRRLTALLAEVDDCWWQWLQWDARRQCITYREGYTVNERLNRKYHLNINNHHDTVRHPAAA